MVMAKVFDYVVPLRHVNDLAKTISEYFGEDRGKLKWIIDFSITSAASPIDADDEKKD